MTVITRPTKTGGGTDVVANNDVLAEEWNGDLNTIYSDYNGNIKNVNCAADMALDGTKLADSPSGVPSVKINDGAVIAAKIGLAAVIAPKVKTLFFDWSPTGNLGSGATDSIGTSLVAANIIPLMIQTHNNGVPSQTTASFVLGLHLNTANGFYYITMVNADSVNAHSRTGLTFRFYYIPLS